MRLKKEQGNGGRKEEKCSWRNSQIEKKNVIGGKERWMEEGRKMFLKEQRCGRKEGRREMFWVEERRDGENEE